MGFYGIYPLVNVDIAVENHNFSWDKFTISMAMFNSYVTNYQRVPLKTTGGEETKTM